jgi:hypothetical protein
MAAVDVFDRAGRQRGSSNSPRGGGNASGLNA